MDSSQVYINQAGLTQNVFLESIRDFAERNNINLYNNPLVYSVDNHDSKNNFESYIKKLPSNSTIFVDSFEALGSSTFCILKMIKELKDKSITLNVIKNNLTLHLKNNLLFQVLESLLQLEIDKIKKRTDTARQTRNKNNTRLGRKKGQAVKSKYDKHKKRILYLHKQGVPNTKIVEDINLGTPQSLGKYIKQVKFAKKRKEQENGTYLMTKEDLKNLNTWNT